MAKSRDILKSGWGKKIVLAFGALGVATMIGQLTGFNNQYVSPVLGYLIGGLPVAVLALLLPMLSGGGMNLGSLLGGARNVPANPNVNVAGTVYT